MAAKLQQTCLLSSPFFIPLSLPLLMQPVSHSEHAPTSPFHFPPTLHHLLPHSLHQPPAPPNEPLPPLRYFSHAFITGRSRATKACLIYALSWNKKNPMQFKSERSPGVKIASADMLSTVSEWDVPLFLSLLSTQRVKGFITTALF